jgi:hypothetical protein
MGWLFGYGDKRKDVIRSRCEGWVRDDGRAGCRTLKKCIRGNTLWTVREAWHIDDTGVEIKEKWIGCDLMGASDGDWGYKDMCESMGPCYYNCPLEYLDEVPMPKGEFAQKWRDTVRAYHSDPLRMRLKVGDIARLVDTLTDDSLRGKLVMVTGRYRGTFSVQTVDYGTRLRCRRNCLKKVAA